MCLGARARYPHWQSPFTVHSTLSLSHLSAFLLYLLQFLFRIRFILCNLGSCIIDTPIYGRFISIRTFNQTFSFFTCPSNSLSSLVWDLLVLT
ncbi:hypothetical protein VNO78_11012 [Psophocarpus tetragonolobus]|uniref:Uncharacterized protein n=1 Tax=Psophocarpus tetragonolobus TaxID=3891 RepID=A0AAN9XN89_PSOTE